MPKYNIIYTAPNSDPYLWDGNELIRLEKTGQENLMFSGKSFKEEDLDDAIADFKTAIAQAFPKDNDPEIKTVQIAVSD